MLSFHRLGARAVIICAIFASSISSGAAARPSAPRQETGFLNRAVTVAGTTYKFQVFIPEMLANPKAPTGNSKFPGRGPEPPPIILFLHGRGERGSEGMWQTQIGLPQELRDHPERWPFIVVMPQCSLRHFWTDPEMLQLALASLDQEVKEFHADPDRTYLTGLSLGGYGAWELAKLYPHRWAAIAIASAGIFWSYAPDRWQSATSLPAEYAHRIGRIPIWLFHGSEDTTVVPRQSDLMFEAFKAESGHIRLWEYQGLHHDSWSRAYNEPELPRWLLSHRLSQVAQLPPLAERLLVPLHPPALKLPPAILDTYVGEYHDSSNVLIATILHQGDQVYIKNAQGDINEIMAESSSTFFYPSGSLTRLTFDRDAQGRVNAIHLRDDRHEEVWEKRR